MRFLEALQLLKVGKRIRREHWCSEWYMRDRKIWCSFHNGDQYCLSDSDNVDILKLLEDTAADDWQFFDDECEEFRGRLLVVKPEKSVFVTDEIKICPRCGDTVKNGTLCPYCWDEVTRK